MTVSNVTVFDRALSEDEIRQRFEAGPPTKTQTLSNWLSSACMKAGGVSVTRREVVLFVANKLGGVHFDARRDPAKHPGCVALDEARATYSVTDLDAAYAELVAIAQQLVSSNEVRSLAQAMTA
ncbi:MAG TPA: hypothetical protein VGO92_01415 [Acidimicrobiales bacterium]|jgi:hypothetical protein|nr:hypothetical protein [Acidimicrobiales bacterium]